MSDEMSDEEDILNGAAWARANLDTCLEMVEKEQRVDWSRTILQFLMGFMQGEIDRSTGEKLP